MVLSRERLLSSARRIEIMRAKPEVGFVATFGATNLDHILPG